MTLNFSRCFFLIIVTFFNSAAALASDSSGDENLTNKSKKLFARRHAKHEDEHINFSRENKKKNINPILDPPTESPDKKELRKRAINKVRDNYIERKGSPKVNTLVENNQYSEQSYDRDSLPKINIDKMEIDTKPDDSFFFDQKEALNNPDLNSDDVEKIAADFKKLVIKMFNENRGMPSKDAKYYNDLKAKINSKKEEFEKASTPINSQQQPSSDKMDSDDDLESEMRDLR